MSSTQVAVIAKETSSQTDFGGAGDKFHEEMFSKEKVAQSYECFSSISCIINFCHTNIVISFQAMRMMRKLSSAEYKSLPESRKHSAQLLNLRFLDNLQDLSYPQEFTIYQERFELTSQVGSGTFGSVYLMKDKSTQEMAASKYLRQTKEKVRKEAKILFQLIHSVFIVRLIGLYESQLHSVLVTEYLSGGDLVTR